MGFAELLARADRAVLSMGGPVTYVPRSRSASPEPIPITGVLDLEYLDGRAEQGAAAVGPALFVLEADLVQAGGAQLVPEADDEVIQGARKFRVREVRSDGMGGLLLHLHERTV